MSIYRRKSANGKPSRFYTAEFWYRGHLHRQGGFVDRDSAKHWMMSESLKLRRGSSGYIKPLFKALVMPLIEQFSDRLRERDRDEMYAYTAERRLNRLAAECAWVTLGDVTQSSLDRWASGESTWRGKPIGGRTKNQYIDIAVQWGKWLASPRVAKLSSNPFSGTEHVAAKHNNLYRRSGTLEELNKLLSTCAASRRLYYVFRIYSPLRAKTIGRLTWDMLHLNAAPPFAKTPAEWNKSKREEKHTLRYDVAQQLRTARRKAKAEDLVFPDAPTLEDFRADLKAAGVAIDDGKGNRRLDYHALRRTLVRIAKGAGLSIDQASLLLGHRDPRTTRKYYDEDQVSPDLGAAVEKLPTLGAVRRRNDLHPDRGHDHQCLEADDARHRRWAPSRRSFCGGAR